MRSVRAQRTGGSAQADTPDPDGPPLEAGEGLARGLPGRPGAASCAHEGGGCPPGSGGAAPEPGATVSPRPGPGPGCGLTPAAGRAGAAIRAPGHGRGSPPAALPLESMNSRGKAGAGAAQEPGRSHSPSERGRGRLCSLRGRALRLPGAGARPRAGRDVIGRAGGRWRHRPEQTRGKSVCSRAPGC